MTRGPRRPGGLEGGSSRDLARTGALGACKFSNVQRRKKGVLSLSNARSGARSQPSPAISGTSATQAGSARWVSGAESAGACSIACIWPPCHRPRSPPAARPYRCTLLRPCPAREGDSAYRGKSVIARARAAPSFCSRHKAGPTALLSRRRPPGQRKSCAYLSAQRPAPPSLIAALQAALVGKGIRARRAPHGACWLLCVYVCGGVHRAQVCAAAQGASAVEWACGWGVSHTDTPMPRASAERGESVTPQQGGQGERGQSSRRLHAAEALPAAARTPRGRLSVLLGREGSLQGSGGGGRTNMHGQGVPQRQVHAKSRAPGAAVAAIGRRARRKRKGTAQAAATHGTAIVFRTRGHAAKRAG